MTCSSEEWFGVGHTRKTQTKGVWMWGETLEVPRGEGQRPLNILLFDTEVGPPAISPLPSNPVCIMHDPLAILLKLNGTFCARFGGL